ncbi:MAG: aminotransferase class III-fold pyridoxal phosphate-dependent enzyme, partial [Bacillota bacterium]
MHHPFREYVNPYLGNLLEQIKMDKSYVRSEGAWLYDEHGERYLDFIASYGALPFGFNPPEIWDALDAVRHSGEPSFVQPSALVPAGELAQRLVEIAPEGLRYVTFTNSGTEANEAAIKLCRSATGRMNILATHNSFHGKTLGSLSATGKRSYQEAFGAPIGGFEFVPYGDIEALEATLADHGEKFAAFLVEPIQGEGGIVEPPKGYLRSAIELCHRHGVLVVFDEVQTGLGRTGQLFASEYEGVAPDVMTLAKALGGGLIPIGAMLCNEMAYNDTFAEKHSSTFAGSTLACRVGLRVLEILTRDDCAILRQIRENGALLKDGLLRIQKLYPKVIKSVRGRGLMVGIEIGVTRETFPGSLIGIMAEQELLTPVLSSWLLNMEHLRVAPTLNGSSVIRLEPSLTITKDQCEYALQAIEKMAAVVAKGNTAGLMQYLLNKRDPNILGSQEFCGEPLQMPVGDDQEGRFAFLVHPVSLRNYPEFDESLHAFSEQDVSDLVSRWNNLVDPFVISSMRIQSDAGKHAYGEFVAIARTADELMAMPEEEVQAVLEKAVKLAVDRGAKIIGLGAYTSVVSNGGRRLTKLGTPLTTGNSYTVVAAVDAALEAARRLGLNMSDLAVAIVGATGAIGRASAMLLSSQVQRLAMLGNPQHPAKSRHRQLKIAGEICQYLSQARAEGKSFPEHTLAGRILSETGLPDLNADLDQWVAWAESKIDPGLVPLVL